MSDPANYLIDTDICSYVIKRRPAMLERLLALPAGSWGISVITQHELVSGTLQPNCTKEVRKAAAEFLAVARIFSFGQPEAIRAAEAKQSLRASGRPTGFLDILIAGHALAIGATLVTNNTKHFENVPGLVLESWARKPQ
jgi:tRNA(fMet)-specific endonuclease VapC